MITRLLFSLLLVVSSAALANAQQVDSVTGTANQVTASPTTGSVVLTTPQDIDTSALFQVDGLGIGTAASSGNIEMDAGGKWLPDADSTTALNIANAAGTDFVTFDTTNSRVGIGITPLAPFHVAASALNVNFESTSATGYTALIFDNTATGGIDFQIGTGGPGVMDGVANKFFILNDDPAVEDYALVVDGLNVGIGTTDPGTLLHVNGNLTLAGGSDIRPSADSTTALNIANAAGTDFVTFDTTNSRVGIGTTPTLMFEVQETDPTATWTPNSPGAGAIATTGLVQATVTTSPAGSVSTALDGYLEQEMTGSPNQSSFAQNGIAVITADDDATYASASLGGMAAVATYAGTGSHPAVLGVHIMADRDGTGNVGLLAPLNVTSRQHAAASSGTVTQLAMVNVTQASGVAGMTFTDICGVCIADMTPTLGTKTNTPFGVKQDGTGDRNYFGSAVGIGHTSPNALLHLKAGTATTGTAPLQFTAGTNLTTAVSGTVEFDGTNYFVTESTPTRYTLAKTLTATATLDFASVPANTSADLTMTLTGAADGDVVLLGVPNGAVVANTSYTAWVSAANTITVRLSNVATGASGNPASSTFRASVVHY